MKLRTISESEGTDWWDRLSQFDLGPDSLIKFTEGAPNKVPGYCTVLGMHFEYYKPPVWTDDGELAFTALSFMDGYLNHIMGISPSDLLSVPSIVGFAGRPSVRFDPKFSKTVLSEFLSTRNEALLLTAYTAYTGKEPPSAIGTLEPWERVYGDLIRSVDPGVIQKGDYRGDYVDGMIGECIINVPSKSRVIAPIDEGWIYL
jgi:hypothetical protein